MAESAMLLPPSHAGRLGAWGFTGGNGSIAGWGSGSGAGAGTSHLNSALYEPGGNSILTGWGEPFPAR